MDVEWFISTIIRQSQLLIKFSNCKGGLPN